ncbi:MAG: undecaprenyldiphospho-muramoylpentapeptide beta-N-acetylglucosaminyltransferase [Desulfobacterales bacterium]|nr:undecaprenyldiphospho-muramoylpentapeptide beta-N-acetylglucosaminyltransferase [Deltaproteobacteria bacterium]MBT8373629.1 undecaprenyldiphospho-muramoylpentapeptide beta-N-acetylglucosaminyltransferase [Deltaproteobacteria bacterium]NNL41166.1 undecaprenyldiphospho-muramoylpentapeptide beta-N-acetylglucosaminyltransferase [Desulfobacterales bacterium]
MAIRILIAGGGTGGHLFPAVAIAQEFIAKDPGNKVIFVSTGNPFESSVLDKAGFTLEKVTVEGIKGRGILRQLRSIWKIPMGIFESIRIINNFKPDLVMGVGSYAAGPVAIGAWFMRKKIVLHEQNILPGITNRILSRFSDRIYVSFKNTKANFNPKKVLYTGNPLRKALLQIVNSNNDNHTVASAGDDVFTILILGGSQGAHSINEAVINSLEHFKEKKNFYFIHQTGKQDEEKVKKAYQDRGIPCRVKPFFDDMAKQYQNANLIICRAGATTVAELAAVGKGVIFIPFPFAADNHQVLNARTFTEAGAAEMILQQDLTGRVLTEKIEYYASNKKVLEAMASRAKSLGKPDAAKAIVADCYKLIRNN